MATRRINVTDNEAWGKLVKTWATGLNYVDHVVTAQDPLPTRPEFPPKYPRPTSFPDFVAQTKTAKVGLVFEDEGDDDTEGDGNNRNLARSGGPGTSAGDDGRGGGGSQADDDDDKYTPVEGNEGIGFVVVQAAADTMVLRLPAKDNILASEKALLEGLLYPLPKFYNRIFDRPDGIIPGTVSTVEQILRLHAERVGEYTINTCH